MTTSRLLLICALLGVALSLDISIVGAGIGGASVAFYHRKISSAGTVRVFDTNDYIGGRLKHAKIAGQVVELGGDAWSTAANHYVVQLVKELGLNNSQQSFSGRRSRGTYVVVLLALLLHHSV